jgi:hypothetical protein
MREVVPPIVKNSLIKQVLNIYRNAGLPVVQINADNHFEFLQHELDCPVECVARGEHVSDHVEHSIRTQEEHTRFLVHRSPFQQFPRIMAASAAFFPSTIGNVFPSPNNSVSKTILPRTVITRRAKLDPKKYR